MYKDLLMTAREYADRRLAEKGLGGETKSRFRDENDSNKLMLQDKDPLPLVSKRKSLKEDDDVEEGFLTKLFSDIREDNSSLLTKVLDTFKGNPFPEGVDATAVKLYKDDLEFEKNNPIGDADSRSLITTEEDDLPVGEASGLSEVNDDDTSTIDFIAGFENTTKESYKAYKDGSQYSIGFGTKANSPNEVINYDEARERLIKQTNKFEDKVIKLNRKHNYDWNKNQIKALTSFAFNNGLGGLNKLIENGNRGNEEISMMMLEYNKADGKVNEGLVKRRQAELDLFTQTNS